MTSKVRGWLLVSVIFVTMACSGPTPAPELTLHAPAGAKPEAVTALDEGIQRFSQGRWGSAKTYFEQAIATQPDLAEAHYNLALALERTGEHKKAREHYIQAANLAPGNKIIWNSPPLKQYGNVPDKAPDSSAAPVLPALGGGGGGPGGGGGGF